MTMPFLENRPEIQLHELLFRGIFATAISKVEHFLGRLEDH